jgi:hypothetical protein
MRLKQTLTIALILVASVASAQLTLDGEIKPRTEFRNGYSDPITTNQNYALYTDQRTRLNFGYSNKDITTLISLQDIRVWGNTSQLNRTDGLLSVHQAWAQIPLDSAFSLKIGRQELVYDDHRIFGSVDWATQARSHDAALLKYQKKSWKVDVGVAYNQSVPGKFENLYTTTKNYKTMQYVWLNKQHKDWSITLLGLNTGNQSVLKDTSDVVTDYKTNNMQTVGTRIVKKHKSLTASLNAYAQFGNDAKWVPSEVNAHLIGIDLVYKTKKKAKFSLGYELISGTSENDINNTQQNSFNPLFGTNHKFNGFMDYFYVGNYGGNVGLQDAYAKYNTTIKKVGVGIDVHLFMAAADVRDQAEFASTGKIVAMDPYLGSEIDTYIKYNINKISTLKAGYSHFLTSETLHAVKGGSIDEVNNWGWLMIIVKPNFKK